MRTDEPSKECENILHNDSCTPKCNEGYSVSILSLSKYTTIKMPVFIITTSKFCKANIDNDVVFLTTDIIIDMTIL